MKSVATTNSRKLASAFFLLALSLFTATNFGMFNSLTASAIAITGAFLLLSVTRSDKAVQAAGGLIIASSLLTLVSWLVASTSIFGSSAHPTEGGMLGVLSYTHLSPLQASILNYTTLASNLIYLLALVSLLLSPACKPARLPLAGILVTVVGASVLDFAAWVLLNMSIVRLTNILVILKLGSQMVQVALYLLSTFLLLAPRKQYRMPVAGLLFLAVGFVGILSPANASLYNIIGLCVGLFFWALGATLLSNNLIALRLYWGLALFTILLALFAASSRLLPATLLLMRLCALLGVLFGLLHMRKQFVAKFGISPSIHLLLGCVAYGLLSVLAEMAMLRTHSEATLLAYAKTILASALIASTAYAWYKLLGQLAARSELPPTPQPAKPYLTL